ncbi:MAG: hypothetical protein V1646_04055 [bacterium]
MKRVLSLLPIVFLFFQLNYVLGVSGEKTLSNIFEDGQEPAVKNMFKSCFADESSVTCDISGKIADIVGNQDLKEKFFTQIVKNLADALTRSGGWLGVTYGTKLKIKTLIAFNSILEKFKQNKSNDFNLIKDLRIKAVINVGTEWSSHKELEYSKNLNIEQNFEKWLEFFKFYANKVHEYNAFDQADKKKAFCFLSPTFTAKEFEQEWQAAQAQALLRGKLGLNFVKTEKQLAPLKKGLADLKRSLSILKAKLGTLDNKLVVLKSKVAAAK